MIRFFSILGHCCMILAHRHLFACRQNAALVCLYVFKVPAQLAQHLLMLNCNADSRTSWFRPVIDELDL